MTRVYVSVRGASIIHVPVRFEPVKVDERPSFLQWVIMV